jgi:hypothetical protein
MWFRWIYQASSPPTAYHGLSQKTETDSSSEEDGRLEVVYRSSSPRILIAILSLSLLTSSLLLYQTFHPISPPPRTHQQELGDCGHSSDEARAHGCRFDPMTWAWQRPECYREELIESFLNRTEWRMYTNYTLHPEEEIPREEWMRGDHDVVYAENKYHLVHCTYMWRKLHSAFLHHLPTDSDSMAEHHSLHCEVQVINNITHEVEFDCPEGLPFACPTRLQSGRATCKYY